MRPLAVCRRRRAQSSTLVAEENIPLAMKRISTLLVVADLLDRDCCRLQQIGRQQPCKDLTSIDSDSVDWHVRVAVRLDAYRMILDSELISKRARYRRRRQQQQLQVSHARTS